ILHPWQEGNYPLVIARSAPEAKGTGKLVQLTPGRVFDGDPSLPRPTCELAQTAVRRILLYEYGVYASAAFQRLSNGISADDYLAVGHASASSQLRVKSSSKREKRPVKNR